LQQNYRKSLILKIVSIASFTLAGLLIILYMLLRAFEDPRVLKRIFGFDSFASFVLFSIGGILTVVIIAGLLIFIIRSVVFSKKLHGPIDALHRILKQYEEGDFIPDEKALDTLPPLIRHDLEDLRNSLSERSLAVQRSLADLKGVAYNLRRITVDSSLRISFLQNQLGIFDTGIERLGQSLADLRLPRPDTFASVLVLGEGPEALALASSLVRAEDAALVYIYPPPPEDGIAALCRAPDSTRFAVPDIAEDEELAAFIRREHIQLSLIAEAGEKSARCAELLTEAELSVAGFGARPHKLLRDEHTLLDILARAKVPCLPQGAAPELGRDYACTAIGDKNTLLALCTARIALGAEDGNRGNLTAGMGAFAPAAEAIHDKIQHRFCRRIHAALRREGLVHRGLITLRVWESENHDLMLRSLRFSLQAPECEAALLSFGHGIARLALAAGEDRLAEEAVAAGAHHNAVSIVFRKLPYANAGGSDLLPRAPDDMRIARYPKDDPDGRVFSLVCSRPSEEETIAAAYTAVADILKEGVSTCRQDIGKEAL
jgi:phosphoribosylamine-glycine ligase